MDRLDLGVKKLEHLRLRLLECCGVLPSVLVEVEVEVEVEAVEVEVTVLLSIFSLSSLFSSSEEVTLFNSKAVEVCSSKGNWGRCNFLPVLNW